MIYLVQFTSDIDPHLTLFVFEQWIFVTFTDIARHIYVHRSISLNLQKFRNHFWNFDNLVNWNFYVNKKVKVWHMIYRWKAQSMTITFCWLLAWTTILYMIYDLLRLVFQNHNSTKSKTLSANPLVSNKASETVRYNTTNSLWKAETLQ